MITACLVTRGDVDLAPIADTLIFPVIVWNNRIEENFGVYGRYKAMERADTEFVYFQDDDCVVPPETQAALAERAAPGRLVANMEHGRESQPYPWLGWGSIARRVDVQRALDAYLDGYDGDMEGFRMVGCDIAVASQIPSERLYLPFEHLRYAFDAQKRVFGHPEHEARKREAYERVSALCS